jgi:hypothetical protein
MQGVKPDVFIATPTHSGDVCCSYALCLLETVALLGRHGYHVQPFFVMNNAIISFARAVALKRFMDSGAEHLLFVDADLYWEARGALKLVQSPHEFVAGVYPAKTPEHNKVFQTRNVRECATQNYVETDGVPGGFMRVKRSAIEKMIEAYPELTKPYKVERATGERIMLHYLFENIIGDDMPLGEDYAFCERWRRIGGKIFICPDIEFSHYGRCEWRGNMLRDDERLQAVE